MSAIVMSRGLTETGVLRVHIADVNECDVMNGRCEQLCVNSDGSYRCKCDQDGYVLYAADHTSNYSIPAGETGMLSGDKFHLNHTCVRTYQHSGSRSIAHGVFFKNVLLKT